MSRRAVFFAALAMAATRAQASVPFEPFRDFAQGARAATDTASLRILSIGALATLGARSVDGEAQRYMSAQRRLGDFDFVANEVLGTGVPAALMGAGFWIYGESRGDDRSARSGQAQLEALFATGVATLAIKAAVVRERPDGSDRRAFPSGHTSTVFATAAALKEIYGWQVGAPSFALAGLVGAARVSANRHWFSDVAGGAVLGVWLGRAFARGRLANADDGRSFAWTWWMTPLDGDGASAQVAFFLPP